MSLPRVSVVTVTRNMVDHLPECIRSVAGQTLADVDHVIIDGASEDGTVDYLRTLDHVRWISEPDDGQSDALAKGFALASGDLLSWLNADDSLTPGAAERAVQAIAEDPAIGLVYGDVLFVEGEVERRVRPPADLTIQTLANGNQILQPGTFFTRAALEAAGGIDPSFHLAMDFDLWLRMLHAGVRAAYVPAIMARFVIHPASKTGTRSGAEFAAEEARALLRIGEVRGAAASVRSWCRTDAMDEVIAALRGDDPREAKQLAAKALRDYDAVLNRGRLFLLLSRTAPWVARHFIRRR